MKLVGLSVKGYCNLTKKQISTLKTLKLKKNTLRVLEDNAVNRGLLSSLSFINWAEIQEEEVANLFKNITLIKLNNPKKGHIYKKTGFKTYTVFKKEFIDRMYLRL